MSDLPQTWTACRLGDVVDYGVTRKGEPGDIPDDSWVLELEDIEKGTSCLLNQRNAHVASQPKRGRGRKTVTP